jgi:hypothetical protein
MTVWQLPKWSAVQLRIEPKNAHRNIALTVKTHDYLRLNAG